MKRQHLLTALLAVIIVGFSITGLHAQTPISGDAVCGKDAASECGVNDFVKIVKGAVGLVIILGLPLLMCFVAYRFIMAWFAREQGNSTAYQDAIKKSMNAILGFLLIVVIFGGGLLVVLRFLGVQSSGTNNPLKVLELFSDAPTTFIAHASADNPPTGGTGTGGVTGGTGTGGATGAASGGTGVGGASSGTSGGSGATGQLLPNFLKATSLYDFLLDVVRLFMRFFVYPALIVIWVWTGFAFVQAQGSPDGINKAKKWLWRAFVSTLVIFMLQTFLTALRGTVEKILPGSTGTSQTSQVSSSTTGGAGAAGSALASQCNGKALGTLCDASGAVGTCRNNADLVFGCYRATQGDSCITTAGDSGYIDANKTCVAGGRGLAGEGGSCINSSSCSGALTCVQGICSK